MLFYFSELKVNAFVLSKIKPEKCSNALIIKSLTFVNRPMNDIFTHIID